MLMYIGILYLLFCGYSLMLKKPSFILFIMLFTPSLNSVVKSELNIIKIQFHICWTVQP